MRSLLQNFAALAGGGGGGFPVPPPLQSILQKTLTCVYPLLLLSRIVRVIEHKQSLKRPFSTLTFGVYGGHLTRKDKTEAFYADVYLLT